MTGRLVGTRFLAGSRAVSYRSHFLLAWFTKINRLSQLAELFSWIPGRAGRLPVCHHGRLML
jgi:hypothetical protein